MKKIAAAVVAAAAAAAAAACVCVCVRTMLCALRYSCGGCQSTTPGRVVHCLRRACCAVCVWLHDPPQSSGYHTTANSLNQTKHRGTVSAAADKAHGAAIDIAAAPCQSSRIWTHAFVGLLDGLALTRPCHISRALVRDGINSVKVMVCYYYYSRGRVLFPSHVTP